MLLTKSRDAILAIPIFFHPSSLSFSAICVAPLPLFIYFVHFFFFFWSIYLVIFFIICPNKKANKP